jgi:hypothetical protein
MQATDPGAFPLGLGSVSEGDHGQPLGGPSQSTQGVGLVPRVRHHPGQGGRVQGLHEQGAHPADQGGQGSMDGPTRPSPGRSRPASLPEPSLCWTQVRGPGWDPRRRGAGIRRQPGSRAAGQDRLPEWRSAAAGQAGLAAPDKGAANPAFTHLEAPLEGRGGGLHESSAGGQRDGQLEGLPVTIHGQGQGVTGGEGATGG